MKQTKYISNGGLAFSEEKDMEKLSKYAKKGWLFDSFSFAGFYYKLVRGEPQQIEYNLDYQVDPDDEYFSLFEAAGWTLVSSDFGTQIFSAPEGTEPIYSDTETIIQKYEEQKKFFRKGALISFISMIILVFLILMMDKSMLSIIFLVLLMFVVVAFVFTAMPYVAYVNRLRKLYKAR